MLAIPKVEVRHGVCVRPSGNGNGESGVAVGEGVGVARAWAHAGFRRIHLVDLDAAAGSDLNSALVDDIIRDGALEVHAHCAVESMDDIDRLAAVGAMSIVVGPRALEEPD